MEDDFEALRHEPDPVRRGRRATDLLSVYQQRSVELARLRRAAIEEARDQLGGNYTAVARAFGLTKGRITQIRTGAPPAHRAFFGVGPLDVALPGRRVSGRDDLVIASEDDAVGAHVAGEAERLLFATERRIIDPNEEWEPAGDAVVVCGPESAHVGRTLLAADPLVTMEVGDDARWRIIDRTTGVRHTSPMDFPDAPRRADLGYVARHERSDGHVVVHIAGLHALGSIGAAQVVTEQAPDLWAEFGHRSFSMVVLGEFDGQTPTSLSVVVPPRAWDG